MQFYTNPAPATWPALLARPVQALADIEAKVAPIMAEVQQHGDAAVRTFSQRFDGLETDHFRISNEALELAGRQLTDALKNAIATAYDNIYRFHAAQLSTPEKIETMPGVVCWRQSVGIESVGLYVPGGTAPLLSTVLMLGIPAHLAGCRQVVLCSPSVHPALLYAAHLVGITHFFRIGGAQAIAAMTFGTETVPAVSKLFGPGNQYVTAAKLLATRHGVAIDMPAGPSEVAVLADDTAVPAYVAADLLSQAEHGPDSQVLLVSTSEKMIQQVLHEVEKQAAGLPRRDMARSALDHSKAILTDGLDTAFDLLNAYAPEHLLLAIENPESQLHKVINAGSVFLGNYTPEAVGDYASGTNHTLPTNGFARAFSGVSVDSFVRKMTVQQLTAEGLHQVGPAVMELAAAESLEAHRRAVEIRLSAGGAICVY